MAEDAMTEAQKVRFGNLDENELLARYARGPGVVTPVTWGDLSQMGLTPRGIFRMMMNYTCLVEGRRKIVDTNTRLTEENRRLRGLLK